MKKKTINRARLLELKDFNSTKQFNQRVMIKNYRDPLNIDWNQCNACKFGFTKSVAVALSKSGNSHATDTTAEAHNFISLRVRIF